MSNAERHNQGKPKLSYNCLGREVQDGEARVWEFGATKYARGNWLKGCPWTEGADSLRRHLDAFLAGIDTDEETGLPHVDHLICCAKILSNAYHTRKDLDDRGAETEENDGVTVVGTYRVGDSMEALTYRVGDKIEEITFGHGVIQQIVPSSILPIYAEFQQGKTWVSLEHIKHV